jgi:aminodeoxyfutalosine synthase|uniref:Aminodeoxyfutalosine synthase n=1 Tax=Desulfobacca acetoxidans TaxID=60893 RepID=A0A7C5EWA9_9BACT
MIPFFQDPELYPIFDKVSAGKRLAREDGLVLYASRDLLGVGYLANLVRERLHGRKAYYIYNQHLNYSNVCVNGCRFCAFGKKAEDPQAYTMTLEEVFAKVTARLREPITEIHIVGGLHPELPFSYYLDMLRGIKKLRPTVHLQAFTAVEIAHLADIAGLSVADTLLALKEAGLGSLPGGGAEVFSPRIRQSLCPKKLSPEGWLSVAQTAHRLGLRTNATMLYGHLETLEERVDHLLRLREAQDETGGFVTFIPLAFHPQNTGLPDLPPTTGFDDLKNLAVARLLLDNFPHIKAFWIMIGPKLAQLSLAFGADDLDGTVIEEKITHMAGAQTPMGLTREELLHLIREAGCEPVERDTLYNIIS